MQFTMNHEQDVNDNLEILFRLLDEHGLLHLLELRPGGVELREQVPAMIQSVERDFAGKGRGCRDFEVAVAKVMKKDTDKDLALKLRK